MQLPEIDARYSNYNLPSGNTSINTTLNTTMSSISNLTPPTHPSNRLKYNTNCRNLYNNQTTTSTYLQYTNNGNVNYNSNVNNLNNNNINSSTQTKSKKDTPSVEYLDLVKENKHDPKYKTELCKSWSESGFCAYGNKCRFAHGKHEMFQKNINSKKYKQKECMSFFKNGYCCYGSRCHFRHEERKLKEINRSYFTHLLKFYDMDYLNESLNEYSSENQDNNGLILPESNKKVENNEIGMNDLKSSKDVKNIKMYKSLSIM